MSIASDLIRGHTDAIILAKLQNGDSYGYQINKDILEESGGQFEMKEATLYTAFRRLESAGYISPYWGDQESGARRRYYSITPVGRDAQQRYVEEWEHSKKIIDKLIR